MRVALLQYPIAWADKATNLWLTRERLAPLRGQADVALLPEMFSTGFCTDRPDLAEPADGETMRALQESADELDIAIVGSFICSEGGRLYNRGFFLKPHAAPEFRDKRHLFSAGGEQMFFTAGSDNSVIEYKGVRFMLQICYDLRFPAWMRNTADKNYDILLIVAAWPDVRIQYWDILIPARAIENQCYVAAVNAVGDDGLGIHYNGHSVAYNTRLEAIARFDDNEEGIRIADFNINQLRHFREVMPIWKDGDTLGDITTK